MNRFRNVFAAGALGIILAVTGCQPYNTANNTDTVTRMNRGLLTGSRYSASNRAGTGAGTVASRNNVRSSGRVGALQKPSTVSNRYSTRSITAPRTAPSGQSNVGRISTDIYGRSINSPGAATRRGMYSNTGNSVSASGSSIGSGNTLTSGNQGINKTGSPFGDYNKDRAYGTAGSSSVRSRMSSDYNIGTAGRVSTGISDTEISRNTGTAKNSVSENTIVRKNFTNSAAQTRSAGTEISRGRTSAKTTRSAGMAKTAHTGGSTSVKSNRARNTAVTGNINTTTGTAKMTRTRTSEPNAVKNTANNAVNTPAASKTGRNLSAAPSNTAIATRSASTGTARTDSTVTRSNNAAAVNNTTAAAGAARTDSAVTRSNNAAAVNNTTAAAGTARTDSAITRSNNTAAVNNTTAATGTARTGNTSLRSYYGNRSGRASLSAPVQQSSSGYSSGARGPNWFSRNKIVRTQEEGAYRVNNRSADVNNRFDRYSRLSRSRGVNDPGYNNTNYNYSAPYSTYGYDNLTFGNSYRNADLRNDPLNPSDYYGAAVPYTGFYSPNTTGGYYGYYGYGASNAGMVR